MTELSSPKQKQQTPLPQLQVHLDNAITAPATTPPNSASSTAPKTQIPTVPPLSSRRQQQSDRVPLLNSLPPPVSRPAPPSPTNQLLLIKAPPTPTPWLWRCHRCYAVIRLSCTRRCFECGHEFCTVQPNRNKPSGRGPCHTEFDYPGWEAWGAFRRTAIAYQAAAATPIPIRPMKASWNRSEDLFATWRAAPGTAIVTTTTKPRWGLRAGGPGSGWRPVSPQERNQVLRKKERMYVRREHSCWMHCDSPSECQLAIYTACVEGRARLVGDGELRADLVLPPPTPKQDKRQQQQQQRGRRMQIVPKEDSYYRRHDVDDSEDQDSSDSSYSSQDEDEGLYIRTTSSTVKEKGVKPSLVLAGRQRRLSGEPTTEHIERQLEAPEAPATELLPNNAAVVPAISTNEHLLTLPSLDEGAEDDAGFAELTRVTTRRHPVSLTVDNHHDAAYSPRDDDDYDADGLVPDKKSPSTSPVSALLPIDRLGITDPRSCTSGGGIRRRRRYSNDEDDSNDNNRSVIPDSASTPIHESAGTQSLDLMSGALAIPDHAADNRKGHNNHRRGKKKRRISSAACAADSQVTPASSSSSAHSPSPSSFSESIWDDQDDASDENSASSLMDILASSSSAGTPATTPSSIYSSKSIWDEVLDTHDDSRPYHLRLTL
ncbi:hypothetical protein B0H66DRAFT_627028 [Apodospora peruviana]|uniref:Uncharacterized protein n=1 Tax=Apodospora peruviana TaxID=516989 RepID=A0AAE0M1D6_9PEZI|nr:hypothetical protein B0H66DRAFT_627028 [Apodospora peruviana]